MSQKLPAPTLTFFCTLEVELTKPLAFGQGREGIKRTIPIRGGRVTGPNISGKIHDYGADWQTLLHGDVFGIDARYVFETDDGAIIEIRDSGFRHGPKEVMEKLASGQVVQPDAYYMRTATRLETAHPDYAWVNKTMFVSTGARRASSVQIDIYAVG